MTLGALDVLDATTLTRQLSRRCRALQLACEKSPGAMTGALCECLARVWTGKPSISTGESYRCTRLVTTIFGESLALPVILARRGPPEGSPPITPGACRSKACALGLRARPRKMNDVHEIRVSGDVFALLKDDAVQRGLTVQRFASLVLSAVALDRLFDAVIDDDHARNRKLEAAKKRKAQFDLRRQNGVPEAAASECRFWE